MSKRGCIGILFMPFRGAGIPTRAFAAAAIAIIFLLLFHIPGHAAEPTNAPAPAAALGVEPNASQDALRAYLQTQEQLHTMELLLEKNRQDARAAAEESARQVSARLKQIEDSLAGERSRELDAIQKSNRVMVIVAGSFAMAGILAMIFMVYFQWRTISRLSELSGAMSGAHLLGPGSLPGEARLLAAGPAQEANQRLFNSLERLEKRLELIEGSKASPPSGQNGSAKPQGTEETQGDSLQLQLAKSQSLLNADRAEEALACLDSALQTHPESAEAYLKRAAALERLGRLAEALESCERAIAADGSFTMAYLQKGGLYNRMERFEEALQCYESALRAKS